MVKNLPDALRLREIKYGLKANAPEQVRVARQLLEVGRTVDALDLFLLAGDEAAVEEIRQRAVKEGRLVLLIQLQRAGREIPAASWKEAGEGAFAAARWREAFRCFAEAEDEDGLARVREKIPDYDLYTPQGK